MKRFNKLMALILSLAMALSCTALPALAAEVTPSACTAAVEEVTDSPAVLGLAQWKNWILKLFKVNTTPTISVTSTIFGSADTGNKSTLKNTLLKTQGPGDINIYYYDENGNRVTYPEGTEVELDPVTYTGEAVFDLGDVEDDLIDSSNATVKLVAGDGYYVDELVLNATALDGTWENGKYVYTLNPYDLEWYTGDYQWSDFNSGREWSCFGGDGNGYYRFNFEVSGIQYDGEEVEAATFPVEVYIWGRDGSDRVEDFNNTPDPVATESSSGKEQSDETQWTWSGEGDQPILCDDYADDFYITWAEGTDASDVTADDVTVALYSDYGDTYVLSDEQYEVFSSEGETQVAVTYMHWAYTPVYTSMEIQVKNDTVEASNTYDVASVYVYMVQQGGGGVTVDGTVTTYSYYGFDNLTDVNQIMNPATYTLSYTDEDGNIFYYAEKETGEAYLTEDSEEAATFDASGADDYNQQLIVNTCWATTHLNQTEEKSVDGETITFDKVYDSRGMTKSIEEAAEAGLTPARGYVFGSKITPYELWGWQDRFLCGYNPSGAAPVSSPYDVYPNGY
jgi:hypothetical protein